MVMFEHNVSRRSIYLYLLERSHFLNDGHFNRHHIHRVW